MSQRKRHHKVIVVTGASRGLGRDVALAFGRQGCAVGVCYRTSREAAEQVAGAVRSMGSTAVPFGLDVRESRSVDSMISAVLNRWGRIDILVNNAGVTKDALCVRMSEQDWDEVIAANLSGPFYCLRAAAGAMAERRSGHIINVASIVGVQGREGQANYASSKAGLIGLTKAAARELGPLGIRVNAVLPGYLRTDMGTAISRTIEDRILKENVLGRGGDAAAVAEFIVHLDALGTVSGQVFNLDSRIL